MLNVVTNNNYFGQQYVFPFNIYKTVASTNSQEHLLSSDQDKGRLNTKLLLILKICQ